MPIEYGSVASLLAEIEDEILHRSLTFQPIRRHWYREPTNGKLRLIGVESVKGKGQTMAANAVSRWSQEGGYFVHLDIRKCYPSIKTDVVMSVLRHYVRSPDVMYICRTLLSTYDDGLEIGSYFSLRMAQLVLSFGYHAVEDMHKVRRGSRVTMVSHQLWYADDIYLFSQDKRNLRSAARELQRLLLKRYGLHLKAWKICRISNDEPVDVVGFTVRPNRVTLRPSLFLRACRAFRKYRRLPTLKRARRVTSYNGWFKHSDSSSLVKDNGFDQVFKKARRHVSAAGRKKHELSDSIGNATRTCAD